MVAKTQMNVVFFHKLVPGALPLFEYRGFFTVQIVSNCYFLIRSEEEESLWASKGRLFCAWRS